MKKSRTGCLVVVVICAGLLLWARSCATPPRDAKLVAQFMEHRAAFERLKTMMQEDTSIHQVASFGIARINEHVAWPIAETTFPEERYRTYMRVLAEAGADQAIRDLQDIRFPVAGWGFASKGWRVAITYRDVPPTNSIESLDDFKKTRSGWEDAYRPITDGWYLWIIW